MTMRVSDELLMAYADGELPSDETRAVEALLAQDPALRARLEPFVVTRRQLGPLFAQRLREPVPDRLIAAIAHAPVARQAPVGMIRRLREFWEGLDGGRMSIASLPAYAAGLVALFAFGATAGWIAGRTDAPATGLIAAAGPRLVASGALATALETDPSQTPAGAGTLGASIVPLLSFRDHTQDICRTYRIEAGRAGPGYAGVACRKTDGTWNVALHVEVQDAAVSGGDYRTAGAESVPAVDAAVGSLIAGDALSRDEEADLLRKGWRKP